MIVLEDTAGLRAEAGEVERIGIDRARSHAANADLIIAVFDSSRPFDDGDANLIALCRELAANGDHPRRGLAILNKSDLPPRLDGVTLQQHGLGYPVLNMSALTGAGLAALRELLDEEITALSGDASSNNHITISRERHRDAIARSLASLAAARASGAGPYAAGDHRS